MEKQKIQTKEFLKSVFEEMHSNTDQKKSIAGKTWLILCDKSMLNVALDADFLDQESQMGPAHRWRMKKCDNLDLLYFPEGNWTNRIIKRIFQQENPESIIIFYPLFLTENKLDIEQDFFSQIFEITEFCKINLEYNRVDFWKNKHYSADASKISVCQPEKTLQLFINNYGWKNTKQLKLMTRNVNFSSIPEKASPIHLGIPLGYIDKLEKRLENIQSCLEDFEDVLESFES